MATPRKPFVSSEHGTVGPDLERLRQAVRQRWRFVEVGSSGRGEITLAFGNFTAYVRKHVNATTWVFGCRWPGGRVERHIVRPTMQAAIKEIADRKPIP